ncbi:MAG: hypothetical protein K5753_05055 [Clostridia bacterium]|nr:hypothetical protein [Clostridia bacterium]
MEEEKRDETSEEAFAKEEKTDFGYMNEMLKAYRESLATRKAERELSEEKKAYVGSAECRVKELCAAIAGRARIPEIKELALMAKESAERCLKEIGEAERAETGERAFGDYPLPSLLSRCVLLLNRALNALVRNGSGNEKAITLLFSQLSALYAIATIS